MSAETPRPLQRAYVIASAFAQFLVVSLDHGRRVPTGHEQAAASLLTAEEIEIGQMAAAGETALQIGQRRGQTEAQVKWRLNSVMRKLKITKRSALVQFFPAADSAGREVSVTPAQERLLELMLQGKSNKQMAHAEGCTYDAIKARLIKLFRRIGVHNRSQAAQWYQRRKVRSTINPPAPGSQETQHG